MGKQPDSTNPHRTLTERSIDQEVCGSGIDEDGVGGDAPCPGGDSDLDGYPDDVDCEPFNKFIYPGISTTCNINGGSDNGWKTCQGDGTFTACVNSATQPLCEAQGSGHCYYFDPVNGDNANDGSYQHPWKDYIKINSDNPNRYFAIPGDVIYFMGGTYESTYNSKPNNLDIAFMGNLDDHPIVFKNYPGEHPIFVNYEFDPSTYKAGCTQLYRAKNIIIEGLDFLQDPDNGTSCALLVNCCNKAISRNLYVHDITDEGHGNLTGGIFIRFSSASEIRTSIVHDCYKTKGGGNVWEILMTSLEPGKTRIVYNTIFVAKNFTMPEDNLGWPCFIGTKHGSLESNVELEIAYNIMYSPAMPNAAIGTGQYNTFIHHNIMFNKGQSLGIYDGGTSNYCYYCNVRFEYNTAVNCNAIHTLRPSYEPDDHDT